MPPEPSTQTVRIVFALLLLAVPPCLAPLAGSAFERAWPRVDSTSQLLRATTAFFEPAGAAPDPYADQRPIPLGLRN